MEQLLEEFLKAADALKILEPRERQAIEHKGLGHTRRQTAVAMGIKPQTVRGMWKTSRQKLRDYLPEHLKRKFGALLNTSQRASAPDLVSV